jgi:hypothetical protein
LKNTKKIKHILNNPDDYSLSKLIKFVSSNKKNTEGVEKELRDKLASLIVKKYNEEIMRKFKDEEENKENIPPQQEKKRKNPPSKEDKQNDNPPPKRRKSESDEDKDKIILALQKKVAELEKELENGKVNTKKAAQIRTEILDSELDESQKQELLRRLEELVNKTIDNEVKMPSPNPLYY